MRTRLKYYSNLIHELHIYLGLFISPFVIIFGISVLALNHTRFLNHINPVKSPDEIRTKLDIIPYGTTDLATARAIIGKLNISGEVDFIAKNENGISFPVNKPGLKTRILVNTNNDSVTIARQTEGSVRAMNYLHTMPGQHNTGIRGNSPFMKIWRIMADIVVYLLLFLLMSGIYLWYLLKFERSPGWYAIILGLLFFTGLTLIVF